MIAKMFQQKSEEFQGRANTLNWVVDAILVILFFVIFLGRNTIDIIPFSICIGAYFLVRLFSLSSRHASVVLMLCGVWQSVVALFQFAGLMRSNHSLYTITGDFGNPGHLGCFLALSVICTIGLISSRKKWLSAICIVSLLLQTAILILSDSRTGWLATLAGVLYYVWRKYEGKYCKYVRAAIICIPIVVAPFLYLHKSSSANGRLLIWKVSAKMIADKPILGYGVKGFDKEYMLYQADYFKKNPNSDFAQYSDNVAHPFNEFIHIATNYGMVGLVLFLLFIAFIWRQAKNSHIRAFLVAYLIICLFAYPSYITGLSVAFFVVVACSQNESGECRCGRLPLSVTKVLSVLIIISCVIFGTIGYTQKRECRQMVKNLSKECAVLSDKVVEHILRYPDISDIYASVVMSRFDVSQKLPILLRLNSAYPSVELCTEIGDCYAELGNIESAISYYTKAHYMVPRRIMPTYRLFCLHRDSNNTEQTNKYANEINTFPYYLVGTKVLRIKHEIAEYLQICK